MTPRHVPREAESIGMSGQQKLGPVNGRFGSLADITARRTHVRFTPMCGRLRVGKDFLERLQHWSVQPCVRPVYAVHMTAGHNALRGSGPDQ